MRTSDFSDSQLQRMRDEAEKAVDATKHPLSLTYGDTVERRNAEATVKEIDKALDDRKK